MRIYRSAFSSMKNAIVEKKLGKYITTQRKGGNGSRIKKPKVDPTHPGNQLQFKFKPKRVGVIAET